MIGLRRNGLVRLSDCGWADVLARPWDGVARECLAYWAAYHLPLVVTRQTQRLADDAIALGLPAPLQWDRRRIALPVPAPLLLAPDDFPAATEITPNLPLAARPAWTALCDQLAAAGIAARVYGSHGWQRLTGLRYLHADSDVDLRLEVNDDHAADAAVALLDNVAIGQPRIDGELAFADGRDVAWREWRAWRSGFADRVLVKRLDGVALEAAPPAAAAALIVA